MSFADFHDERKKGVEPPNKERNESFRSLVATVTIINFTTAFFPGACVCILYTFSLHRVLLWSGRRAEMYLRRITTDWVIARECESPGFSRAKPSGLVPTGPHSSLCGFVILEYVHVTRVHRGVYSKYYILVPS